MSKADRASTTRRSLLAEGAALAGLAGGFTLVAGAAYGAEVSKHPDAAILAHEPALSALQAEINRLCAEAYRLSALCEDEVAPRPDYGGPGYEAWAARRRAVLQRRGHDAAQAASDAAVWRLGTVLDALVAMPALTLDGLCLKARYGVNHDDLRDSVIDDLVAIGIGGR